MSPRFHGSARAAIDSPVVKDGELPVGRRVDVELDDVGACREGRLHRGDRVLEKLVFRRAYACGRAGVVLDAVGRERLRNAAMSEQRRLAGHRWAKDAGVGDEQTGRDHQSAHGRVMQ